MLSLLGASGCGDLGLQRVLTRQQTRYASNAGLNSCAAAASSSAEIAVLCSRSARKFSCAKPWWFSAPNGKIALALRYGAKPLEIAKGKNAIEVANMDDLVATLEVIKQAVHAGELDAQIEQASGALRAGFAKKKK